MNLLLHPKTKLATTDYISNPSHSLILVGPKGSGKSSIARYLVEQVIGPISNNPYFVAIEPEKNTISIEKVRELQHFVRLKTTGSQTWRRAILIEDAQFMTIEAQNAFLKLLEEPPADTIIILTTTSSTNLLPTISSRAPKIDIKPVGLAQTEQHFASSDSAAIKKAYLIGAGLAGSVATLLDDELNGEQLRYIDLAKDYLKMSAFERLVYVDSFLKQKDDIETFLWALLTVSKAALGQAVKGTTSRLIERWNNSIEVILAAQDALPSHPLPKLLLTDLSLQI